MGTIAKSLNLLNFFCDDHPEIGLTEFRRLSGQDKATVHRHLVELTESGFLEQDPVTRAYRLGPAILRLAAVREALFPTRKALAPLVDRLAEELGELVHVTLLDGVAMSPVYHHDPVIRGTRVHLDPAEMLPLHATSSGICQLAFGPPALAERVLGTRLKGWTEWTITDRETLRETIAQARATGIAQVDQGFEADVSSFAAPVFGIGPQSIGALAVAIPVSRHTAAHAQEIIRALKTGARAVTEKLGGVFPDTLERTWRSG